MRRPRDQRNLPTVRSMFPEWVWRFAMIADVLILLFLAAKAFEGGTLHLGWAIGSGAQVTQMVLFTIWARRNR